MRRGSAEEGGRALTSRRPHPVEEVIGIALPGDRRGPRQGGSSRPRPLEEYATYATVVEIDQAKLPARAEVEKWSGEELVKRLRHDQSCPEYSIHLRQLVHVSFKVAAEMGPKYHAALDAARETAGRCVTDNLFDRHIRPLFLGTCSPRVAA